MSPTSYLRMRQASEAGLVSEMLLRLSKEAKRTRAQTARPMKAIGRVGESAGERTRQALRDVDYRRRTPASGR
jgi:hypothetical protein